MLHILALVAPNIFGATACDLFLTIVPIGVCIGFSGSDLINLLTLVTLQPRHHKKPTDIGHLGGRGKTLGRTRRKRVKKGNAAGKLLGFWGKAGETPLGFWGTAGRLLRERRGNIYYT